MSSFLSIGDITIHPIIEQEGPFLPALTCSPLSAELLDENRRWLAAKARDRSTGSADRLGDHAVAAEVSVAMGPASISQLHITGAAYRAIAGEAPITRLGPAYRRARNIADCAQLYCVLRAEHSRISHLDLFSRRPRIQRWRHGQPQPRIPLHGDCG